MYGKSLLTLLVLVVLLGRMTNAADATFQGKPLPRNGKIAYQTGNEVYLMDADGSNPTFLVKGSVSGWSPDGKQLLLDGGQRVLTLDTGKITPVFPEEVFHGHELIGTSRPVWSPDGKQIAMVNHFEMYTIKSDGTGLKLLYQFGPGRQTKRRFLLSWSPDSKQLAFPLFGKPMSAHVIEANGNGLAMLRNSANVYPHAWSPDGRYIFGLLESEEHWGLNIVVAIEVKTGKVTQLTEPIEMTFSIYDDYNLVLSPDGKTLAYANDLGQLYTVGVDGGPAIQITQQMSDIDQLQWSPDGKQLIMDCDGLNDDGAAGICTVNADGTDLRLLTKLSDDLDNFSPAWQPLADQ